MAEAASVSLDDQGRVVITHPQLAEALKKLSDVEKETEVRGGANNVTQCGCNVVAHCGGLV